MENEQPQNVSAQPQPMGPPPMAAPPGQVVINVKLPDGSTDTWDERHIAGQLQQAGFPVSGFSSDGTSISIADQKGNPQPVPIETILAKFGVGINSIAPSNVDYSTVHPGWRAAMTATGFDDDMKKSYLEAKVRREWGVDAPKIMGQGSDWHLFHNGQWRALTNKPGADMSDVGEYGSMGLNMLGSAVGGTIGSVEPGAGTILGAAAGGAGASALQKLAAGALDPDAREIMAQNKGAIAGDVAQEAALGGAAGALPIAAKALGPAAQRFMTSGPVSGAVRGMSRIGEAASEATGKVAGWLAKNPQMGKGNLVEETARQAPTLARGLAINAIPGAGSGQALGWLSQLPAGAVRGVGKLFGRAAQNTGAEEAASALTRPRAFGSMLDQGANALRGTTSNANNIGSRDILGNAAESLGQKIFNPIKGVSEEAFLGPQAPNMSARAGLGQAITEGQKKVAGMAKAGERAGDFIETLSRGGKSLESGIDTAARGTLRATQGAANVGSLAARGTNRVATAVQPFEIPLELQGLGRHYLAEEQRARFSPSLLNKRSGTIMAGQ